MYSDSIKIVRFVGGTDTGNRLYPHSEKYQMTELDGDDRLRSILLAHSDSQAVRNVFSAHTGHDSGAAEPIDYIETLRATGGEIAIVGSDGESDLFVRWNPENSRYERVSLWPPWSVGDREWTDSTSLEETLKTLRDVQPILHEKTPFVDPSIAQDSE